MYRYRTETGPYVGLFHTVTSEDAPYEDQDAHFWDWTLAVLIMVVVGGFAVWGISAVI